jgi:hypothetical protein
VCFSLRTGGSLFHLDFTGPFFTQSPNFDSDTDSETDLESQTSDDESPVTEEAANISDLGKGECAF